MQLQICLCMKNPFLFVNFSQSQSRAAVTKFSFKGPNSISDFMGQEISVTTTQLCHGSMKASIDNM